MPVIPLMRNTFFDERETREALARFILEAPKLSMGEQCSNFEAAFARYHECRFAILFNSGASANLALVQACKNLGYLREGDAVGFSALTWSTNVMPILQMGFKAVPVDCSRYTLNSMSWQLEERLKTCDLKAFFITNALGFAGDLGKIREICHQRKILLLEDNCEALGTRLAEGRTGNFGLGSTFSFFVAHHMSTIEGGMVCTEDGELAEMLTIVRAHGWDRNLNSTQQTKWRRRFDVQSEFFSKYVFYELGFNLRPTEITGFLGLNQLRHLERNIDLRNVIFEDIEAVIGENSDLVRLDRSHLTKLSSFGIPILCKSPELRDRYMSRFENAGVEIRPMIAGNIQRQPFYQKYVRTEYALPETEMMHECGFYCGNYPEMTAAEVNLLKSCLRKSQLVSVLVPHDSYTDEPNDLAEIDEDIGSFSVS